MKTAEFNKKYEQYLVPGFYGLAIEVPEVVEYLDTIFELSLTKLTDFKYYQIKTKFGFPRCYFGMQFSNYEFKIEHEINEILNK